MDPKTFTAYFSTEANSGLQVGQNSGSVNVKTLHYHIQAPSKDEQNEDGRVSIASAKEKCHQLFRLTANHTGEGYEWYKNRIEERIPGTCEWFLNHENYQSWKRSSSGLLLVSADPGCGKSVLARFLVEHELPGTVFYFFFKDQDQNTLKQALCALLHQIFSHKPSLITCALPEFRENGPKLIDITDCLWTIFRRAIRAAGDITFVLDGLDECNESDLRDLIPKLKRQFPREELGSGGGKFLLTTRPYQDVISEFWELVSIFPGIRIPGEKFSKEISDEVNHVVRHRVSQLGRRMNLRAELQEHLEKRLSEIQHRTYLWIYLVFDYLEQGFTKTKRGIEKIISALPENINEAYEKILGRSKDEQYVRRALSVMLGATRPLTLMELNIATSIETHRLTIDALDLEDEEDFQNTLRDRCGLFVSVQNRKVYLLHQTARDFLLPKSTTPHRSIPQAWQWCGSIDSQHANALLARLCLAYLNFHEFNSRQKSDFLQAATVKYNPVTPSSSKKVSNTSLGFLHYAAVNWPIHLRNAASGVEEEMILLAMQSMQVSPPETPLWYDIYRAKASYRERTRLPLDFLPLIVASCLRLDMLVERLCLTESVNQRDRFNKTALHYAADLGNTSTIQLLLHHGAEIDSQDLNGHTALSLAVRGSEIPVLLQLLDQAANVNLRDGSGATALHHAVCTSSETAIELLLYHQSNVDVRDSSGQTALHHAASRGNEAAVQLLLESGADVSAQDGTGRTALFNATMSDNESAVRVLLQYHAETDIQDSGGRTVLHWAVQNQHEGIAQLLLDRQAEINALDFDGQTALHDAVWMGDLGLVKLLLDNGANLDERNDDGRTALHEAVSLGDTGIVEALLNEGADTDLQDNSESTALHEAVEREDEPVVELLVKNGASSNIHDGQGETALDIALDGRVADASLAMGYGRIVRLLLCGRADLILEEDDDDSKREPRRHGSPSPPTELDEVNLLIRLAEEHFEQECRRRQEHFLHLAEEYYAGEEEYLAATHHPHFR